MAAVAVAGVVVHARTPKLELEVLHIPHTFSPNGDGEGDTAHITFYVRDSDPNARAQIVGPDRQVVHTLYRGPLVANKHVTVRWNGHRADPHDAYRLRVVLPAEDRDMVYPTQIRLAR